ncbi:hypothetical protein DFS34DRAFT_612564 [Phlyctochytrium arcticum]|nr:hypothetical protein DFS34DRAFT_612564 [Phlyctochytrium arcticum]
MSSMTHPADPAAKAQYPYASPDAPTPQSDVHMKGTQSTTAGSSHKMDDTKAKNLDHTTSTQKQLDDLYKLIDGIETAMFTTRARDGSLVSRAMQTRKRTSGADLWFFTNTESHKLDDLDFDDHVNIAYYKPNTSNWVSASGRARIVKDPSKIKELWTQDIKAWFADKGDGVHNGEATDPRVGLIFVETESAHYQLQDKSGPRVLFEMAKGALTGEVASTGPMRDVDLRSVGQQK